MNAKGLPRYLYGVAFVLSTALNCAIGAGALTLALIGASLTPPAKSLIHSTEGQAFLAAAWTKRNLLRELAFPPKDDAAQFRFLVRVIDELETSAGRELITASLSVARRPELSSELPRASAELKKAARDWMRENAKARAASAEFRIYGKSLESVIDGYIDNALRDLTEARDAYPALVSSSDGTPSEKPLARIGEVLDRFFERHPLPDLSFVKNPPNQVSESAIAPLNDGRLSRQITALNFQKTVAPPGGLAVSLQIQGQSVSAIVSVAGFEFLREFEANERCFVSRYRPANGYPVILSYESGRDIVAFPACLSTDLVGGTMSGPLKLKPVTIVRAPLLGEMRLNLADKATRSAVFSSTVKKLGTALRFLPPKAGREFIAMLARLFPAAMREITPQLPDAEQSIWASTRRQLLAQTAQR